MATMKVVAPSFADKLLHVIYPQPRLPPPEPPTPPESRLGPPPPSLLSTVGNAILVSIFSAYSMLVVSLLFVKYFS